MGTLHGHSSLGQAAMMIIHAAKPLFAWDCLEDSPSLRTIRELLAALPDGKLLHSLRTARGKGRDDGPVSALWGAVVLGVALRHATTDVRPELNRRCPRGRRPRFARPALGTSMTCTAAS